MKLLKEGTLRLSGPEHLLETPTREEIEARIAGTKWRTDFARIGALEYLRMGLFETRVQLEYACAEVFLGESFPSWAAKVGVRTEVIVRSRSSRGRR